HGHVPGSERTRERTVPRRCARGRGRSRPVVADGLGAGSHAAAAPGDPLAPPERLVVGGLYRYVRNPMYLAVGAIIVGQALLLARSVLLFYAAAFAVVVLAFVRLYEEPTLAREFGAEYENYCRAVPGLWPRLRPWRS